MKKGVSTGKVDIQLYFLLLFFIHFIAERTPPKGPNPSLKSFVKEIFFDFVKLIGLLTTINVSLNSSTIQIINDDIAGIYTLVSGDYLQVAEGKESATFAVGLLSQPSHDVKIRISEDTSLSSYIDADGKEQKCKKQLGIDNDNDGIADSVFKKEITIKKKKI